MVKVERVIAYLMAKASENAARFKPTAMQAALYYAQAWNLAFRGEPLFDEDFAATLMGERILRLRDAWKGVKHLTLERPVGQLPRWVRNHLDWVMGYYMKAHLDDHTNCWFEPCDHMRSYDMHGGGPREFPWEYVRRWMPSGSTHEPVIPRALIEIHTKMLQQVYTDEALIASFQAISEAAEAHDAVYNQKQAEEKTQRDALRARYPDYDKEAFEQTCDACGEVLVVRYKIDRTYSYVWRGCQCESTFSPAPDSPSITDWLFANNLQAR